MTNIDKRLVLTLNSGEKVALPQGNPLTIGDRVLVIPTNNGEFATTGNNPIKTGDTVVVLTTNTGEKVSVSVEPPTPIEVIDCIGGDNVNVYLLDVGINIPIVLPPCCMVQVTITQIVRVFSYPDPDYNSPWGILVPPYKATHFNPNITNIAPQVGYVGPWGIFVEFADSGEYNISYNNEESTNVILSRYDWLTCPSNIPGSQNVCWVTNTGVINGLVYGEFDDYLTSRSGLNSLNRDYTTNPELMDGGNIITVNEVTSGYCDKTKVQIELRISRTEYNAHPEKYQLIG